MSAGCQGPAGGKILDLHAQPLFSQAPPKGPSLRGGCKAEQVQAGKSLLQSGCTLAAASPQILRKGLRPSGEPSLAPAQSAICKSFSSHSRLMSAKLRTCRAIGQPQPCCATACAAMQHSSQCLLAAKPVADLLLPVFLVIICWSLSPDGRRRPAGCTRYVHAASMYELAG